MKQYAIGYAYFVDTVTIVDANSYRDAIMKVMRKKLLTQNEVADIPTEENDIKQYFLDYDILIECKEINKKDEL